ncbi:MAG TPA: hypothetical protein VH044_19275 [Polyangiaceae bacterium]|jgi:hypothetical protein|nr:hypothetical protein [Polyangiaceae bacterium]
MRTSVLAPFALFAAVATAVAVLTGSIACTNQGEGDYCDPLNGDNDCQNGLKCEPAPGLSSSLAHNDRCCPTDTALATTEECMVGAFDGGGPTETPDAEAGAGADATLDAPSEATVSDAPAADTATEAATTPDASADAGNDAASALDSSDGAPE